MRRSASFWLQSTKARAGDHHARSCVQGLAIVTRSK